MFGFQKEDMKIDGNFRGSISEKLGFSKYLCPVCNAHLKESRGELICLNTCHLPKQMQINFQKIMKQAIKKQEEKSEEKRSLSSGD